MLKSLLSTFLLFALTTGVLAGDMKWSDVRPSLAPLGAVAGTENTLVDIAAVQRKPVVVTFWASWCPPCTDEFAHLNDLIATGDAGDAQIIGVNVFEAFGGELDPLRMAEFIGRTAPKFPTIIGNEKIRDAFGGVDRIPTVVVFSATGEEVWRFVHIRDAEKTHATRDDILHALSLARQ